MYLDFTGRDVPADVDTAELRRLSDYFAEQLNESGFYATTRKAAPFEIVVDLRPFTPPDAFAISSGDAIAALATVGIKATQDQRTGVPRTTTFLMNPSRYAVACQSAELCVRITRAMAGLFYSARTYAEYKPGAPEAVGGARFDWNAIVKTEQALREIAQLVSGAGAFPEPTSGAIAFAGPEAIFAVGQLVSVTTLDLLPGYARRALLLMPDAQVLDEVIVARLLRGDGEPGFAIWPSPRRAAQVALWLRAVAAGVVEIVPGDPWSRIHGLDECRYVDHAELGASAAALAEARDVAPFTGSAIEAAKAGADIVMPSKVFFIGQKAIVSQLATPARPEFTPSPRPEGPPRRTVLYDTHVALGGKQVPFAGWEMPVQYPAGIFAEHRATRTKASLFDVSHMSVFDFTGPWAGVFLETLLANRVLNLPVGRAAYQYLLRPNGIAADDTYVYRLERERYMLVVNAANADSDWEWINAAASNRFAIDPVEGAKRMPGPVQIRDLRSAGADSMLDLALQGPGSRDLLIHIADSEEDRRRIAAMKRNHVARARVGGCDVWLAMTGYTGEPVGYEIFVHPDRTVALWNKLCDAGASPAGLGARDAARLEAGLPLFGHELEGPLGGTLTEAGYGWVARLAKPWFVGRGAYRARLEGGMRRKLVRLAGQGAKSVREGHVILDDDQMVVGTITSFAFLDEDKRFVVLAYVDAEFDDTPGHIVKAARIKDSPQPGEDLTAKLVDLTVLSRFPSRAEQDEWRRVYAKA